MNQMGEFFRNMAGKVVVRAMRRRLQRFERQLHNARAIQQSLLLEKIRRCSDSQFGRDHRFDEIKSPENFRNNIPIEQYEYFYPYIEQVAKGNMTAMFPASEKLLMFTLSSGTTGDPKLIPINKISMNQFRRSWQMWGIKAFIDHPPIFESKVLNVVGNWDTIRSPSNIPCGQASGLSARIQNPLLRMIYAVPPCVFEMMNAAAKEYLVLRLSIAEQVGFFSTAIPVSAITFAKNGNKHRETLIRDIADGTLSEQFDVPREVRAQIDRRIRVPNMKRARELEQIVEKTGCLYPKDYWNLALVACWLGGTVGTDSRHIAEFFGNVPCRDIGIVASEGRLSIPLEDGTTSGVLDILSHYYEFIPEDEIDSAQPTVLECHELEVGKKYFILMTTDSGLYRYNIYDVVRCTGYMGEAPLLEFLHKGQRCSDLIGEKVTEYQLVMAVDRAVQSMGLKISQFTSVPVRPKNGPLHYAFMLEEQDVAGDFLGHRFLDQIDQCLSESNPAYVLRRNEGHLGAPRLVHIQTGSWARYRQAEIERTGAGDDQYKHASLVLDESFLSKFPVTDTYALPETPFRRAAA